MTALHSSTTADFWSACNERKLLLRYCTICRKPFYYPRTGCPFCGSDALRWKISAGIGIVYTYSHVEMALGGTDWEAEVPYTVIVVDLEDGVRFLSRLVGPDHREVEIGDRVEVEFVKRDEQLLPYFKRRCDR
jgi:uncharacterized protein